MAKLNQGLQFLLRVIVFVVLILIVSVAGMIIIENNEGEMVVQTETMGVPTETQVITETLGITETQGISMTEALIEIQTTAEETISPPKVNPFEDYIKLNPDFVGWIKVNGTTIDSPIVQGDDNEHYLKFNYKNQRQSSGAIYLDYRNAMHFYDNHLAVYGHYMKSGTVFHDLHLFKDPDFFEKNRIIEIQGLTDRATYEIFSVQLVDADDYYLLMDLDGPQMLEYIRHLSRASMHKRYLELPTDVDLNTELKILTLCTCTYEFGNARILIHAIKR